MICGECLLMVSNVLLIFVDGIDYGILLDINFIDIEFIEVLKDVFFIVIYGIWGVNGIIMIMIKKGKEGKLKVFFNVFVFFIMIIDYFDIMDVEEYV